MFGFIKKAFFTGLTILWSVNLLNTTPFKCISMTNQECIERLENVHSDEPIFYPFSIKTSKCVGNCNNINDTCAKICVPHVAKNLNVKVFNLMSRSNETRYIEWHETYKCKCSLDASVSNNKQHCNNEKCMCEWKELIDKIICARGCIWNSSICECECDKSCDIGEYLDYENCKCKKILVDKLVERSKSNKERSKIELIFLQWYN